MEETNSCVGKIDFLSGFFLCVSLQISFSVSFRVFFENEIIMPTDVRVYTMFRDSFRVSQSTLPLFLFCAGFLYTLSDLLRTMLTYNSISMVASRYTHSYL